MTVAETAAAGEIYRLALGKMSAVLGPDRARQLLRRLLDELGIALQTPQDLFRLSEAMSVLGGFEGAVGAMLGVAAVIRGAVPSHHAGP